MPPQGWPRLAPRHSAAASSRNPPRPVARRPAPRIVPRLDGKASRSRLVPSSRQVIFLLTDLGICRNLYLSLRLSPPVSEIPAGACLKITSPGGQWERCRHRATPGDATSPHPHPKQNQNATSHKTQHASRGLRAGGPLPPFSTLEKKPTNPRGSKGLAAIGKGTRERRPRCPGDARGEGPFQRHDRRRERGFSMWTEWNTFLIEDSKILQNQPPPPVPYHLQSCGGAILGRGGS